MTILRYARLTDWPGTARMSHRASAFKSSRLATIELVRYELSRLDVPTATLELDLPPFAFKRDGTLATNSIPDTPGIVLGFAHPQRGPVRIPSDLYWDAWDNLRAIGVAMEAERAMRRHGIGAHGEVYEGFKALPPGMTPETAAVTIATYTPDYPASSLLLYPAIVDLVVKIARNKTHPDRNNGERAAYDLVEQAREVLLAHHRTTKEAHP